MTETKNFALKLPDPADMVDIGALNENFEKIDEEMGGGYYELDLREIVTWDRVSERVSNSFVLSEYADKIDLSSLYAALQNGKDVLLRLKTVEPILNLSEEYELTMMLDSLRVSGNTYNIGKTFTDNLFPSPYCGVFLNIETDEDSDSGYYCVLQFGEATGGSNTESAIPTNTTVVKSDGTVTITTTLEGDKQSVTTITVDENDYPTKINTDGTEWPVTWEGF